MPTLEFKDYYGEFTDDNNLHHIIDEMNGIISKFVNCQSPRDMINVCKTLKLLTDKLSHNKNYSRLPDNLSQIVRIVGNSSHYAHVEQIHGFTHSPMNLVFVHVIGSSVGDAGHNDACMLIDKCYRRGFNKGTMASYIMDANPFTEKDQKRWLKRSDKLFNDIYLLPMKYPEYGKYHKVNYNGQRAVIINVRLHVDIFKDMFTFIINELDKKCNGGVNKINIHTPKRINFSFDGGEFQSGNYTIYDSQSGTSGATLYTSSDVYQL